MWHFVEPKLAARLKIIRRFISYRLLCALALTCL